MRMRRQTIGWLSLVLLLGVAGAQAQAIPFSVEVGYRWADISGNEEMYRTQIDERSGFLLRSFTLNTTDFHNGTGLVDRVRIDVSDLGVGPAGFLRVDTGKGDLWRFRLGYRNTDQFSALPTLANPFVGQGVIPGQHTWDRTRNIVDAELEILPNGAVTPFVGFTWNRNEGPGTTSYHVGQDEFLMRNDLEETDKEIRLGLGFNYKQWIYGQVMQGWRDFSGSDTITLAPGATAGNVPGNVLGRPVTAETITLRDETDGSSPFTNVYVTAQPMKTLKVTGNYVRVNAESDATESETDTGSFASFAQSIFFGGLTEQVTGSAKNDTWRGGARAELTIVSNVDLLASYQSDHREMSGSSLIDTLYREAVTFGGVTRGDVRDILETDNGIDRDQDVVEVGVSARALGPFAVRATYSQTDQDVTMTPDVAEIVVPGGAQGGAFNRSIDSFNVVGSFAKYGLMLSAAYRNDSADDPVLRTDYLDRDRTRLRASYTLPNRKLRLGVTGEQINQDNDRDGIGYDSEIEQLSADVELDPIAALRLHGSYSQLDADSTILFRRPENFQVERSVTREDGNAIEGGVTYFVKRFSIDAGYGTFENRGTNPFDIERYRLRATLELVAHTGVAAEWSRDKYRETQLGLGDYDADRFGLFLRWNP